MKHLAKISYLASSASRHGAAVQRRAFHGSALRYAITNLQMPAMSPTMTEGGISQWKKKEGEEFSAGDVLLEVETDKATIDVEAQDDGIMGKIILPDGAKNVPVGKVIALLAEEGDDISNLQPPKEDSTPSKKEKEPTPPPPSKPKPQETKAQPPLSEPASKSASKHPKHSRPLFPSVLRLLQSSNIENPESIKGTGVRGMLTKGDVLAHLGKASSPTGTYKEGVKKEGKAEKKEEKPIDAATLRKALISNVIAQSQSSASAQKAPVSFDSILAFYAPTVRPSTSTEEVLAAPSSPEPPVPSKSKNKEMDFINSLF